MNSEVSQGEVFKLSEDSGADLLRIGQLPDDPSFPEEGNEERFEGAAAGTGGGRRIGGDHPPVPATETSIRRFSPGPLSPLGYGPPIDFHDIQGKIHHRCI